MDLFKVSGLSKSFGRVQVLRDVDLSVTPGERVAIIGPNGAGKTTLFQCISGLLPFERGTIHIGDQNITSMEPHKRARCGLARTFQVTNLFMTLTILDNVLLAVQAFDPARFALFRPRYRFDHLLDRAQGLLAEWNLTEKANVAVKDLSYGEQRELEIILALAGSPIILLLDEPTAGLASEDRKKLTGMIERLSRSITLLLIEHDLDVAFAVADNVKVMHTGHIMVSGSPSDIMKNEEVQEIYLGADYAHAGG